MVCKLLINLNIHTSTEVVYLRIVKIHMTMKSMWLHHSKQQQTRNPNDPPERIKNPWLVLLVLTTHIAKDPLMVQIYG